MALIPIENKRGGVALPKNLYLVKNGVCDYSIVNYSSGGFTTSSASGVFSLTVNRVNDVNYGKLNYSIDTSQYYALHILAKRTATTDSSARVGVESSNNSSVTTWSPQVTLTDTYTEHVLYFGTKTNILFYSGSPTIQIKDMWLEPYPTRLSDGELYAYGIGANDLTNEGFGWGEFPIEAPVKNERSITTTCVTRGSTQGWATKNPIDLTSYSKIKMSIIGGTIISSGYNYSVRLLDTKTHLYKTLKAGNATSGIVEIDISSESGSYYILQYPDYTSVGGSATISRVWLE